MPFSLQLETLNAQYVYLYNPTSNTRRIFIFTDWYFWGCVQQWGENNIDEDDFIPAAD